MAETNVSCFRGNAVSDSQIPHPTESSAPQCEAPFPFRILVVEDDIFFRLLNTEALVHSGFVVDAVEDGAAGWAALSKGRYDLMITDNSMPNISGVELLRKLHDEHIAIPVIMATGAIPTDELARCPALQPSAMLQKPYPISELVRMVKKVLRYAEDVPTPPRPIFEEHTAHAA